MQGRMSLICCGSGCFDLFFVFSLKSLQFQRQIDCEDCEMHERFLLEGLKKECCCSRDTDGLTHSNFTAEE